MPNSERIRFANLGALTLIPAILGTCAMSYAISMLTKHPQAYLGAGLLWGLVVLLIDRYLISTLYKSSIRNRPGTATSVIARFLFAVLIGIAVAHPLVLLWFNDSITQNIDEHRRAAMAGRTGQVAADVAAVPAVTLTATSLEQERDKKVAYEQCLVTLQTYEQSNLPSKETECGVTSGSVSCGPRCAKLETRIAQARDDIAILDQKVKAAQDIDKAAQDRRQVKISQIEEQGRVETGAIDVEFSHDYLARVRALAEIEQHSPQVLIVEVFMILFFVFVDVMPLTMKLATRMGEYEHVRDTALMKSFSTEAAKQEIIGQGVVETALAKMYSDAERTLAEINELTRVPLEVFSAWNAHREVVEQTVQIVRQATPFGQELETEEAILAFRQVDHEAVRRAMDRAKTFVEQA